MYGIVLSALFSALGFLARSVLVKFVVFFGLFFITTEFMGVIGSMLPTGNALSTALGGIPSAVWYFFDLFNLSVGLPALLSAYVTRFIIRRIPVIG